MILRRDERFGFRHEPMLGTVVEIVVITHSERLASRVSDTAAAEIERLESVFSKYRPDSELRRWTRDEVPEPSPEFCIVMAQALRWQHDSGGAFNPLTGAISRLWADAERSGQPPPLDVLADAAESIAAARFEMRDGLPVRLADCTDLDLNAIAKGYIVDRALTLAVTEFDPAGVLISAGGDLAHRGRSPVRIGIENPLRPFDNEPHVACAALGDAALATSGGSRRGPVLGGHRHSHVIDPRTGCPVECQASISVLAPTALEADVLATAAGVMPPVEAVAYIEQRPDVGCLVIDPGGVQHSDSTWRAAALDCDAPVDVDP